MRNNRVPVQEEDLFRRNLFVRTFYIEIFVITTRNKTVKLFLMKQHKRDEIKIEPPAERLRGTSTPKPQNALGVLTLVNIT